MEMLFLLHLLRLLQLPGHLLLAPGSLASYHGDPDPACPDPSSPGAGLLPCGSRGDRKCGDFGCCALRDGCFYPFTEADYTIHHSACTATTGGLMSSRSNNSSSHSNNSNSNVPVQDMRNASLGRCHEVCSRLSECHSFTYNHASRGCVLHAGACDWSAAEPGPPRPGGPEPVQPGPPAKGDGEAPLLKHGTRPAWNGTGDVGDMSLVLTYRKRKLAGRPGSGARLQRVQIQSRGRKRVKRYTRSRYTTSRCRPDRHESPRQQRPAERLKTIHTVTNQDDDDDDDRWSSSSSDVDCFPTGIACFIGGAVLTGFLCALCGYCLSSKDDEAGMDYDTEDDGETEFENSVYEEDAFSYNEDGYGDYDDYETYEHEYYENDGYDDEGEEKYGNKEDYCHDDKEKFEDEEEEEDEDGSEEEEEEEEVEERDSDTGEDIVLVERVSFASKVFQMRSMKKKSDLEKKTAKKRDKINNLIKQFEDICKSMEEEGEIKNKRKERKTIKIKNKIDKLQVELDKDEELLAQEDTVLPEPPRQEKAEKSKPRNKKQERDEVREGRVQKKPKPTDDRKKPETQAQNKRKAAETAEENMGKSGKPRYEKQISGNSADGDNAKGRGKPKVGDRTAKLVKALEEKKVMEGAEKSAAGKKKPETPKEEQATPKFPQQGEGKKKPEQKGEQGQKGAKAREGKKKMEGKAEGKADPKAKAESKGEQTPKIQKKKMKENTDDMVEEKHSEGKNKQAAGAAADKKPPKTPAAKSAEKPSKEEDKEKGGKDKGKRKTETSGKKRKRPPTQRELEQAQREIAQWL